MLKDFGSGVFVGGSRVHLDITSNRVLSVGKEIVTYQNS